MAFDPQHAVPAVGLHSMPATPPPVAAPGLAEGLTQAGNDLGEGFKSVMAVKNALLGGRPAERQGSIFKRLGTAVPEAGRAAAQMGVGTYGLVNGLVQGIAHRLEGKGDLASDVSDAQEQVEKALPDFSAGHPRAQALVQGANAAFAPAQAAGDFVYDVTGSPLAGAATLAGVGAGLPGEAGRRVLKTRPGVKAPPPRRGRALDLRRDGPTPTPSAPSRPMSSPPTPAHEQRPGLAGIEVHEGEPERIEASSLAPEEHDIASAEGERPGLAGIEVHEGEPEHIEVQSLTDQERGLAAEAAGIQPQEVPPETAEVAHLVHTDPESAQRIHAEHPDNPDAFVAAVRERNRINASGGIATAGRIPVVRSLTEGQGNGDLTYLYQKLGSAGEHLKYGVTNSPGERYAKARLAGGRLKILTQGPRESMLALERNLHETLPIGPEEGQKFYVKKQIQKGLKPPPYDVE